VLIAAMTVRLIGQPEAAVVTAPLASATAGVHRAPGPRPPLKGGSGGRLGSLPSSHKLELRVRLTTQVVVPVR
jgi:hypothetical protein